MANLQRPKQKPHPLPTQTQQLSIAYESTELRGITPIERTKVLAELASLLVLAAADEQGRPDDVEQ